MSTTSVLLLATALATDTAWVTLTLREVHLGVELRMTLSAPTDSLARTAAAAAFREIARLEDLLSDWRPTSELRRLEHGGTDWQPASPELTEVLARAMAVARASGGAFDPTIGALTRLWRQARRSDTLPAPGPIAEARSRVGARWLQVDTVRRRVRLSRAGMQLDLGGIAKGYLLQRALTVLRHHGTPRALVEAGGDLVVGEAPPGRSGWSIAVPFADSSLVRRSGSIVNAALATSGPVEQFIEVEGRRESHVIDPRTGRGVSGRQVATVIGTDAAVTDAVATALTILPPAAGRRLLAAFGLVGSLRPAPL
ncbi:MAG: FAD:protein FMN transferase [Gemmatimonadales bacterium]